MLVVGGLGSANTRKLYETCKRICGRTLLVERAADIPPGFGEYPFGIHWNYRRREHAGLVT